MVCFCTHPRKHAITITQESSYARCRLKSMSVSYPRPHSHDCLLVICRGVSHSLFTIDTKCTRTKHTHTHRRVTISIISYLLDVLEPGASSVGPVKQVFDKLARHESTANAGAVGRVTTSSSFSFSGSAAAAHTHVSIVASQASPTISSSHTTTSGSSRNNSFRRTSSETCDNFEEDTKRTQPQYNRDNKIGLDCEQAANLLDAAGGDMTGKNMDIEVSLHLDGDQAGADLDLDMMQPQKAAMQVCVFVIV